MEICLTDVITGCSCHAFKKRVFFREITFSIDFFFFQILTLKLLLMVHPEKRIPRNMMKIQKYLARVDLAAMQKYVPWIVEELQNLANNS